MLKELYHFLKLWQFKKKLFLSIIIFCCGAYFIYGLGFYESITYGTFAGAGATFLTGISVHFIYKFF